MSIYTNVYKDRRTGMYYYRKVIPPELRETLGRTEIRRSLKTKAPGQAKIAALAVAMDVENQLQQARQASARTDKEIAALAIEWLYFQYDMENMDTYLEKGTFIKTDDELVSSINAFIKEKGISLSEFDYDRFHKRSMRMAIEVFGTATGKTPLWETYRQTFPKTEIEKKAPVVITITDLLNKWKAERNPGKQTAHEFTMNVERFVKEFGNMNVKDIDKALMREFKDRLINMPKIIRGEQLRMSMSEVIASQAPGYQKVSAKTVNKYLGYIGIIFNWGVNNGYMEINPSARLSVSEKGSDKARIAYTPEDMQKIIAAVSVHKNDKATAERYWLTVLAMYTGARLEELGQSDIADIKNQNGIIYLDIHNNGEDRSLKTHSSKRFVPLHADLLELGFMDYVKSLDGTKLFPNLKPNVNGSLTATFSKWYNKYARRTVGIEDSRKVFHSFRHAFKERCREAGIMTEVHDRLTGHTPANVGGSYGDYPLTVLSEAIGKLRFPIV